MLKKKQILVCAIFAILLLILSGKAMAVENYGELYELDNGYVTRILPQTTVMDFSNNLEIDEEEIKIIDKNGNEKNNDELVGTGMKLVRGTSTYILSVIGDLDGNGKITDEDLTNMRLGLTNISKLENEYEKSSDINGDGKITITDLTQLNFVMAGLKDIIAPDSFIPTATKSADTITISGETTDNDEIVEYYFKIDNGEWVQNADKTKSRYTFTNLEKGKEYKFRMKVKDREGNQKITQKIVEKIPRDLQDDDVRLSASTKEWTKEDVIITLEVNDIEGNRLISLDDGETFFPYTNPVAVSENTTVVARVDSKDYGIIEKSLEITNIDKTPPKEFTVTTTCTSNSIRVSGSTEDTQSGLDAYYFSMDNGENWVTNTDKLETEYTFTNLNPGEIYNIKMKAVDKVGNEYITEVNSTKTKSLHTLTIEPNGGIFTEKTKIIGEEGTQVQLTPPTKMGYDFSSWSLTGQGQIDGNTFTFGDEDATLRAEWKAKQITVTYNYNGATSGNDAPSTTVTYEGQYGELPNPEKCYTVSFDSDGGTSCDNQTVSYSFKGWYKDEGCTDGNKVENTTQVTTDEEHTLYAKWEGNGEVSLPEDPTKAGYTFEGWYEDKNFGNKVDGTDKKYTPTKSITLYAKWEEYYGALVEGYSVKGVDKWRIFHKDEQGRVYLIADDYVKYDELPKNGDKSYVIKSTDYKVGIDARNVYDYNEGVNWIESHTNKEAKKWLNIFLTKRKNSTYSNMEAVAYMMDTGKWSKFVDSNYAEYALGGPTLELYCASYKVTHPKKYLECDAVNLYGYGIRWNGEEDYNYGASKVEMDKFNKIYVDSNKSKAEGYWIASPSGAGSMGIVHIKYDGWVYNTNYTNPNYGFRPVVCLKSGVNLVKQGNGTYKLEQ